MYQSEHNYISNRVLICLKEQHVWTPTSLSSSRLSITYTEEDIISFFEIALSLRMTYNRSNYVSVSEICHSGNYSDTSANEDN